MGLTRSQFAEAIAASNSLIEEIIDFVAKLAPERSRSDIYWAMVPLDLLAWARAARAEKLDLDPAVETEVGQALVSAHIGRYLKLAAGPHPDTDLLALELAKKLSILLRVWNENQESPPSPHWYVGKEVTFWLTGDRSDPNLINYFGGIMSEWTISLVEAVEKCKRESLLSDSFFRGGGQAPEATAHQTITPDNYPNLTTSFSVHSGSSTLFGSRFPVTL